VVKSYRIQLSSQSESGTWFFLEERQRHRRLKALAPSSTISPDLAETTPSNRRMTPRGSGALPRLGRRFSVYRLLQPASLISLLSFFNSLPVLIVGVSFADFVSFQRFLLYTCTADRCQSATAGATRVKVIWSDDVSVPYRCRYKPPWHLSFSWLPMIVIIELGFTHCKQPRCSATCYALLFQTSRLEPSQGVPSNI